MPKPPTKAPFIPDWEDLKHHFDLDEVAAAVRVREDGTDEKLTVFDFEDIAKMIWHAADWWMGRDLVEFSLTRVEERLEIPVAGQTLPFKGFLDVGGTINGTINPFKEFAGVPFIMDWKSRDGSLSTEWKDRLVGSMQWKLYAAAVGAKIFIYRGLSRQGDHREVIIAVPDDIQEIVNNYLVGSYAQRDALVQLGMTVYPQTQPDACNAFGRECPHFRDCEEYTMPRAALMPGLQLSYTSLKRFYLCPERYRRGVLDSGSEDSPATIFGQAMHRGLATLYKQAMKVVL